MSWIFPPGGIFRPMERIYPIAGGDYEASGEAAGKIKKLLIQLGLAMELVRRIAIAAYEAEMNIVIHAYEGELTLRIGRDLTDARVRMRLVANDRGPGIPDIDLAMKEGYSTAPEFARRLGFGSGMGLPNMKRCSDQLTIISTVGKGTTVTMDFTLD
ncbi:MAG TPA: anti-sigma regulatory factor [Bacillota bacterium]